MPSPVPSDSESAGQTPARSQALEPRFARILDFEREWWRHAGAKEEAIREEFGLSAPRYYQLLNIAIELPEAVRYDPMLVGRLQRVRNSRTAARATSAKPTSDLNE